MGLVCQPFMPSTSEKLKNILNLGTISWNDVSLENPINLKKINKAELIFRKIEDEEIERQLQKLNEGK